MTIASVALKQVADFRFEIRFADHLPALTADEPPPLGQGDGPSPTQLLCAAVGNCLSDSLLFALRKFKQTPEPLECDVEAEVGRNPEGRLRILGMRVHLRLGVAADTLTHVDRALAQFEEFCTVTQSVRQAFPVRVTVTDAAGTLLHDRS